MVFTTYLFVFYFLPLVLLVYYGLLSLARGIGLRAGGRCLVLNVFLVVASYLFYGWWNPSYILLMLAVTVVNYVCGQIIGPPGARPRIRYWGVTVAIVFSLTILGFFKYATFVEINVNRLLAWIGSEPLRVFQILLPMGISFYTFHALSYSVDVYRGKAPPVRSLVDFACYIALYPQLVAGPIIRYNTVADQLVSRTHTSARFSSGVALFVLGFAKKVLLANPMGRVSAAAFNAQALSTPDAWFGAVAYAFQIYFDFCGYSDMAVGLGRMIGFEFMKNFDAPYRADSITDFWRRWHISLSTFLRDYLYIPLGGNRQGPLRTYFNLIVVMLLGGLWHGASWTFVAWGAYHGVLLAYERFRGKRSLYHALPRFVQIGTTFVLVLFSWVLFRSTSFHEATSYLGAMFGNGGSDPSVFMLSAQLYTREALINMASCAAITFWPIQAHDWSTTITWPKALVVQPLFALSLMAMFSQSFNPFLYFQF